MSKRYRIRMHESGDGDGSVVAGTVVRPIDRSFSLYAVSADEVERKIHKDVIDGKLEAGRVYQICPEVGNAELGRIIAIDADSNAEAIFLDAGKGLYSGFRRIRCAQPQAANPTMTLEPEAVEA